MPNQGLAERAPPVRAAPQGRAARRKAAHRRRRTTVRGRSVFRVAASLVALLIAGLPEAALALTGEVTHLSGSVIARRPDGQSRILAVRSQVDEGDLLVTAENTF